jgi:hypothetical protein
MSDAWIGKAYICSGPLGKSTLFGRVIAIDEVADLVVIARAPKCKADGSVDNYVASPKFMAWSQFKQLIAQQQGHQLTDFEPPAHWLWSDAQLCGEVSIATRRRSRARLPKWKARRDLAYSLIESLVQQKTISEIVFAPDFQSWPRMHSNASGKREVAIRRALNMYLFGLGNCRALLPAFGRCGGPGKEKFSQADTGRPDFAAKQLGKRRHAPTLSKLTRQLLRLGWRKFKKPGVSDRVALNRIKADSFAKSISWNGTDCIVQLKDEAADLTTAMLRYWGTKEDGDLTGEELLAGQTPSRREYVRRLNAQKGRFDTLNGKAFIDSTSADQTLRSASTALKVLSSPWRTEVLGGGIDYIFGIHVGFESPSATTALLAALHAAGDKVALCERYGHIIGPRDWFSMTFHSFEMDNGEGKGKTVLRTLEDMESSMHFGAAYDAINKSIGESGHHSRQAQLDHLLPGSTLGRRKRRGEPDRSQLARLTFDDYMHLLIKEILRRNNEEYIDPPRLEMYEGIQERTRRGVVEWMIKHHYLSSAPVDLSVLRASCLPRLKGVMHGNGVRIFNPAIRDAHLVPGLLYRSDWLERSGMLAGAHRRARRLEVHMNPSDLSHVWVNIDGMKRLELISNDPDLERLCLLDWLSICADNKLKGYLSKALEVSKQINQVATIEKITKQRNAERAEEIKALNRKPTKTELKRERRANTTIEAAAHTGIPRPLPGHEPHSGAAATSAQDVNGSGFDRSWSRTDLDDALIKRARELFDRWKHG